MFSYVRLGQGPKLTFLTSSEKKTHSLVRTTATEVLLVPLVLQKMGKKPGISVVLVLTIKFLVL